MSGTTSRSFVALCYTPSKSWRFTGLEDLGFFACFHEAYEFDNGGFRIYLCIWVGYIEKVLVIRNQIAHTQRQRVKMQKQFWFQMVFSLLAEVTHLDNMSAKMADCDRNHAPVMTPANTAVPGSI